MLLNLSSWSAVEEGGRQVRDSWDFHLFFLHQFTKLTKLAFCNQIFVLTMIFNQDQSQPLVFFMVTTHQPIKSCRTIPLKLFALAILVCGQDTEIFKFVCCCRRIRRKSCRSRTWAFPFYKFKQIFLACTVIFHNIKAFLVSHFFMGDAMYRIN